MMRSELALHMQTRDQGCPAHFNHIPIVKRHEADAVDSSPPTELDPRQMKVQKHLTKFCLPMIGPQWYLASPLPFHVCNDRSLFLSDFAEVRLANGEHEKELVLGRGSVEFTTLRHDKTVCFQLVDVAYVTGAKHNMVSQEKFERCFPNTKDLRPLRNYVKELEGIIRGPVSMCESPDDIADAWYVC